MQGETAKAFAPNAKHLSQLHYMTPKTIKKYYPYVSLWLFETFKKLLQCQIEFISASRMQISTT